MRSKPDHRVRRALELLAKDHVYVVSYHYCPQSGFEYVRQWGVYSTKTGMRVPGFGAITFNKILKQLRRPVLIQGYHVSCPDRRGWRRHALRLGPPDRVYQLKNSALEAKQ